MSLVKPVSIDPSLNDGEIFRVTNDKFGVKKLNIGQGGLTPAGVSSGAINFDSSLLAPISFSAVNLNVINGGLIGDICILIGYPVGSNVTVVTPGNIILGPGGSYSFNNSLSRILVLMFNGSSWVEFLRT